MRGALGLISWHEMSRTGKPVQPGGGGAEGGCGNRGDEGSDASGYGVSLGAMEWDVA